MTNHKTSLSEAVHRAAGADTRGGPKAPSSDSPGATKGVLLRLPAELHHQLRQLALDDGTSLQALGVEALKRLLKERQR